MATTDNTQAEQVREVVGVFGDAASLQDAIDELLTSVGRETAAMEH